MQYVRSDTPDVLARKVFVWTAAYALGFIAVVYVTMFL